ncbi:uncharacterized protein LOC125471501 [Pyrus x bretschneideri]|uniref:uncharacterized protein LOC125471501 n=1 Tax=Pyrus x bretschneideri TaxID=225117 RepID=UPI00202EBE7E|nr:uncharacterized protein LOC125471501 [Pyrus x bretschneideri]
MTELRPIPLCNVVYKIIAKVLTKRLKNVMDRGVEGDKGRMAVKLDMAKAYDRVEWSFLIEKLYQLIYEKMKWKDKLVGCGWRLEQMPNLICFFADDSVVFCKADEMEARNVIRILEKYGQESGQIINLEKSSIFFGKGCLMKNKKRIVSRLNIQARDGFGKYLGIQADFGH